MILFVAHDPGAKNHLFPLYRHALRLGYAARFLNLAQAELPCDPDNVETAFRDGVVKLLVCGCSVNRAEWRWVTKAKRLGIRTAMIIDIGTGSRIPEAASADSPDQFLVTSYGCVDELRGLGFPSDLVHVTGSTHLEYLSLRDELKAQRSAVRRRYGLEGGRPIVSLFCPCDETTPGAWEAMVSGALSQLHALLQNSCPCEWILIVRPHPRSSRAQITRLEEICRGLANVRPDGPGQVDTPSLLACSLFSLSLASTVSVESLVLGTPSAFFQMGWKYDEMDRFYVNLSCVPRLRTAAEFHEFVSGVVADPVKMIPKHSLDYTGATARSWESLRGLVDLDSADRVAPIY